jgi:hypothetical protein
LQAPGWTELQLERLQKAWEPVDLVEAVEKGLVGQRAVGDELFALARRSGEAQASRFLRTALYLGPSSPTATFEDLARDYLYFPVYKITSINADELFYLQTLQEGITGLRLLKAHRPWPEAKQALVKAGARVSTLGSGLGRFRYCFSAMGLPYLLKAGSTAVNLETERQLTLAAIALKRFQMRHGQLPPSLEALVLEFLPAVPYDYMSAKPLRYPPNPDGNYVLYSVGVDGKDDGGDPSLALSATPGLWGGRDAVWPWPATEPEEPSRPRER